MLIEQLQSMQSLLEARQNRRSERHQLQALSTQEDTLQKLVLRWQGLHATATYLGNEPELIQEFRDYVGALRATFATGVNLSAGDLRRIEEKLALIENKLQARWLDKKRAIVNDVLVARVRIVMVIGGPAARQKLQRMNQHLNEYLSVSLPSLAQYQALVRLLDEMEQTVSAVLPEMSGQVGSFLEKLSRNEARLDDITPEILDWCREHNLIEKIALQFSGG